MHTKALKLLIQTIFLTCTGATLTSCSEKEPSSYHQQRDTLEAVPYGNLYLPLVKETAHHVASVQSVDIPLISLAETGVFEPGLLQKNKPIIKGSKQDKKKKKLTTIDKTIVWVTQPHSALLFECGMSIDADGSPRAYHPKNIGLDDLKHAGKNGRWWALATKKGKPVIQKSGYYVSMTSLQDFRYSPWDQRRYVDAEKIPYIVLPPKVKRLGKVKTGDMAVVYNTHNHKLMYAIYADTGADTRIGEGSIALAKSLGINANARTGGIANGIIYLVFPGSGNGKPRSKMVITAIGRRYFKAWGGLKYLR